MRPLRTTCCLLATATVLTFGPSPTPASTIEPLDLRTIAAQSELIVVGRVRSVVDHSTASLLLEYASIDIGSVLHGSVAATRITVRVRQGIASFDRRLKRGDSGVFFLVPGEGGIWDAAYPGSFALFEGGAALDLPR